MSDPAVTDKAIKEVVKLAQLTGNVQLAPGGSPFVVVPEAARVEDLSKLIHNDYAPRPHRIKSHVTVSDVASFLAYWETYHDDNSRMFADENRNAIYGVLDYHQGSVARWGSHRVTLQLQLSEEWNIWNINDKHQFSQTDFAEFLEDNSPDIFEPPAASMLDIARTFQASSEMNFRSAVRLQNSTVQLVYNEVVSGAAGGETGELSIPEWFRIQIPVYVRSPRKPLDVRFRYRLNRGTLTLWYSLVRPLDVLREAFRETVTQIRGVAGDDVLVFGSVAG